MSWFAFNNMQANPDRVQAIAIGNKNNKQNIVFDLNGNKINCDDEVKLLGITIDFKLDFNKHISNICKKKLHVNLMFLSELVQISVD
jgi:hypothetical protein